MSKTKIQMVASVIILAVVLTLSGCDYDFALSPKQGLPLDARLIGIWQKQVDKEHMQIQISRKPKNEYGFTVSNTKGENAGSYRGYPIRIGNQKLIQLIQEGKSTRPYQVLSYVIKGDQLTLKFVRESAKNQAELRNAVVANSPDSYGDVGTFNKTTSRNTPPRYPSRTAAAAAAAPAAPSFSAAGLNHEKILTNIYLGNFSEIPFGREDLNFSVLYDAYLNSYAQQCDAYLPRNKVEITKQECATERVTTNGYGAEISRSCVNWVWVGTGLYADPEMYEAKLGLRRFQSANELRMIFDLFKDPGKVLVETLDLAGNAIEVSSDMNSLVKMNSCSSSGLKRFQENLKLFALKKQPITLSQ